MRVVEKGCLELLEMSKELRDLSNRVTQSVLRWFWHMERTEENRTVKRIVRSDIAGMYLRGR